VLSLGNEVTKTVREEPMLTAKQILKLLELTQQETVAEFGGTNGYVVKTKHGHGYSKDPEIGGLQATLSIMLEVASK